MGLLIGITGLARSGKDTFAKLLAQELYKQTNRLFVLIAYAQELKLRVQKDFDLSYEQLWGDEKETYDLRYKKSRGMLPFCAGNRDDGKGLEVLKERQHWTSREIVQDYGEFYRTIDSEFWVKHLFKVIKNNGYKNVIITDVRHFNEADSIINKGGCIIKINRENSSKIHNQQHASETSMRGYNKIDFIVNNNGTMDDLKLNAIVVTKQIIDKNK
jgi:hypothetical protein